MFNWVQSPSLLLASVMLVLIQFIAALPWLRALSPKDFRNTALSATGLGTVVIGLLIASVVVAMLFGYNSEATGLIKFGRLYAAVLHVQLVIDFFILAPALLVLLWPKGGAVAFAAFREGWRQPMFWLVTLFGILMIFAAIPIPYFTFGDDYKMMKQIGYDTIMLSAALFGVLASSISVSEEIEGRTAITVMSKPINRRQFLIGKFLGILMACMAMSLIHGLALVPALWAMPEFDPINKVDDPLATQAKEWIVPYFLQAVPGTQGATPARSIMFGASLWFSEAFAHHSGIILGFGQVSILVAIATALATRIPFVVNLVICLSIYFIGNLAPVIVRVTEGLAAKPNKTTGIDLVNFIGRVTDAVLPNLESFKMNTAIIRETPLNLGEFFMYVGTVSGYSLIYTVIALLVGLILFEDRDLA